MIIYNIVIVEKIIEYHQMLQNYNVSLVVIMYHNYQ